MVSYCSNMSRGVFSVRSGTGIPPGMVVLEAGSYPDRCERYGEIMTREEAQAEGIRQGYLIEFRSTESFWYLAKHFLDTYSRSEKDNPFDSLCKREELEPDYVIEELQKRKII